MSTGVPCGAEGLRPLVRSGPVRGTSLDLTPWWIRSINSD